MFYDDLNDENVALKALNAAYIHGVADARRNNLVIDFDEKTLDEAEHFADLWQDRLIERINKSDNR